ncbi:DUF4114 domain-containing protein [Aquabacter sp. CN5-332]|uniref:DUF4114 domain-containing protein n=1 Tax=Aquabacter sp. CN5-332 TaxID=3156608 RepID=UPI0032B4FB15
MPADIADTDAEGWIPAVFSLPKGGLYGGAFDSSSLDPNIRSVMMDYRWTTSYGGLQAATTITYSFPTSATDYTNAAGGYPGSQVLNTFQELTAAQKAAVHTAFDLVSSYTNLTFVEVNSGSAQDAAFRFAQYGEGGSESRFPANSGSYAPSDSRTAGDTYLGGNGNPPANYFGTDHFNTIMHEMGHAFGLKHGHDTTYNGALAATVNDNEFSVMTYASYFGADTNGATEAWVGSAPQSYMMYDIAALQAYYGANFDKVGTEAIYTWDPVTGQQYINGVPAADTGVSSTGKIFSTVWTGGAASTYDLSNFSENQEVDLRPGHWLAFSQSQIADLNNAVPAGTAQYQAQGNIYNALLYNGDQRSLVSSVITGVGSDTIVGNEADNTISANAGNDTIFGGRGNDTISGGAGADLVQFDAGSNVLRDQLADLNGDVVMDLGVNNRVDIQGILLAHSSLAVTTTADSTLITTHGSSFELRGNFSGGDFMAAARGGADSHTELSYVNFLPTLSEGVSVNLAAVNGIANAPFLTGDGTVGFSMQMESAVSNYSNMLGYYTVSVDGTISDVHLAFANTLAAGNASHLIDIGTPDAGEHIGFFLIQNGFSLYGGLPDDLSFVGSDASHPADIDAGAPPVLYSASRGLLDGAQIFHSFADLNAGDEQHVLSGTSVGGDFLRIGFEDVATSAGDNDFQDVVFSIHTDLSGLLLV